MITKGGWLRNEDRRQRRDNPNTFTDEDGRALLEKIDAIKNYISPKFGAETDLMVRLRDKALISVGWTWFKRGGEFLRPKRRDVFLSSQDLSISFSIEKKRKRAKFCPTCGQRNSPKSNFCQQCQTPVQDTPIVFTGKELIVTKTKTLKYYFVGHVVTWLKVYDEQWPATTDGLFFPPLKVSFNSARFNLHPPKPMTIQHLDRILQRLDPKMTSCMFRYGGAEKGLRLGFTKDELKEVGDWASSEMPGIYAQRKGLTPAQRRWGEETR